MSDKEKYIEQLIYKELQPDRYCYIHNYIVDLKKQLQQKENIIKEVREFAKLRKEMYKRQENVVGQEVIISILNILDKGE